MVLVLQATLMVLTKITQMIDECLLRAIAEQGHTLAGNMLLEVS